MISIVFLTDQAASQLVGGVVHAGHRVWQARSVPEVMDLCERQPVDAIVVDGNFRDLNLRVLEEREITLRAEPGTNPGKLIWELSKLFPDKIQIVN